VRAEREAREQAARAKAERTRRLRILGAAVVAALLVVVVLVVVSQGGEDEPGGGLGGGGSLSGAAAAVELFEGIPQEGTVLGEPDAPVRMLEFVDLQCPFCAEYTENVLPSVVDRYVRSGDIRLELRLLSFIGEDSVRAANAAAAAAEQNGAWQFTDLFYRNQGSENSGYVTDDFIRSVASSAGLDPGPIVDAANAGDKSQLLRQADREAAANGVNSTPSFLIGREGQQLQPLPVEALSPDAFAEQIDRALQGG
jgi:protein-disulfide isomerase